jgi:hypothetical protein
MGRHRYSVLEPTAEMALWVGDEEPRLAQRAPIVYTSLGEFVPKRRNPIGQVYARRIEHVAKHLPRPKRGSFTKWAHSVLRDAGEFLVGAFQPVKEAW